MSIYEKKIRRKCPRIQIQFVKFLFVNFIFIVVVDRQISRNERTINLSRTVDTPILDYWFPSPIN